MKAWDKRQVTISALSEEYRATLDKRVALLDRVDKLIRKMTEEFLADEIDKAVDRKLDHLEREPREIHRKVQRGMTI